MPAATSLDEERVMRKPPLRRSQEAQYKEERANLDVNVERTLNDFRQDLNVLAQHLKRTREDFVERLNKNVDISNATDMNVGFIIGEIIKQIERGEVDGYAKVIETIVKEDNEESRKKLFEDIERAIAQGGNKNKSSSGFLGISGVQWLLNIGLIVVIALGYIKFLKG